MDAIFSSLVVAVLIENHLLYLFNAVNTKQIKVFQFSTFFSIKMIHKICKKLKLYKKSIMDRNIQQQQLLLPKCQLS